MKGTQSKRERKESNEKLTSRAVENSDLSTVKSTGCGKLGISTRVFNRLWKTVLIIYICLKQALWKSLWKLSGKAAKLSFKKERSNFLFLRRLYSSKKLHFGKSHLRFKWEEKWKDCRLSDWLNPPAGGGCSYAEGAQGDSDAVSLWIYARGGVRFSNKLHHRPLEQLSRAVMHKP